MTQLSTRQRRLAWLLTGKTLLALAGIATVALGLVTYSASLTLTINPFFKEGLNTIGWSMTTSTGARYLPQGASNGSLPGAPSDSLTSSFAFRTQNGTGWVRVGTSTQAKLTDFQSFKIFVLTWNSSSWSNATLYTNNTFLAQLVGGIDGTSSVSVGYLHVSTGAPQVFYAIQVNYILAASPADTSTSVVFSYTPNLN